MKTSPMKIILRHNLLFLQQDGAPTPKSLSPTPGPGPAKTAGQGAASSHDVQGGGNAGTRQEGSPRGKGPQPSLCASNMLLPLLGFGVVFYFLLIRPQQKQEKQRKALLASVKKGDKIITTGGIHGEVVSLDDRTVTIKFGNDSNQRMTLERAAIGRVPAREAELPTKGGG